MLEIIKRKSQQLMQRIFLTGLSGSGKSSVGRKVSELLHWDFIDTDTLLSKRYGMPVGQILVEFGEQKFRQIESEALILAAGKEHVVIATGGGAVISAANRSFMQENGLTFYLETSVEIAWQRVQKQIHQSGKSAERPLVGGMDGQQRMQSLFLTRRQWYEEAELCINTNEDSLDTISKQVVAFALSNGRLKDSPQSQETVTLQLGKVTSKAIIDWDGLYHLPEYLKSLGFSQRIFIVTDSEVGRIYDNPILSLLRNAGFVPQVFTVAAGEASKSICSWQQILNWLVEQKAEQREPIIALGGGVIGDLTGFVAATYHRGIPLVQIPTTLLAQVDSALGGKTGINHPLGKNLIGAFYQPELIIVDPASLLTLPERVYLEGWAEIVKYGMILDADLFETLEDHISLLHAKDATLLTRIITRCIQLKMDVVERDERDGGLRNILNYGHTFGHALEILTDYGSWLHGEAVAVGMEVAAQIAVSRGLLTNEHALRQRELLLGLHLPLRCPGIDAASVLEKMQRDKKVRAGQMRWILPIQIGQAEIYDDIPLPLIQDAVARVCS
jgi:3-dehydroquinate synthase/shikimate kinase/3-dehydroquinate synthase